MKTTRNVTRRSTTRAAVVAACCATAVLASSCSLLKGEQAPGSVAGGNGAEDIEVTSSTTPEFAPKEVPSQEVTGDLTVTTKDEGLGVEWTFQGVYNEDAGGTVVTVLMKNLGDTKIPAEALDPPKLEVSDGSGGFTEVKQLDYNPEVNTSMQAPGLDLPLGAKSSANLQYLFDTQPANLWDARFTVGNVTWVGDLNI